MTSEGGKFQSVPEAQAQNLPGLEKDMNPSSESTRLEGRGELEEYKAAGKLAGKTALITGGDSGIGRAVAVLYAREGADVTIVYLPEEEVDAKDTKQLVEREGKSCTLISGDLMKNDFCKHSIDEHMRQHNKLDVLVNNASKQFMCKDFSQIDLEKVESTFRSNILQMFAMTKYAVPHMKEGGSIINVSSTVAYKGVADMVDYGSTKGAIIGFTRSLAKNLVSRGIRVNAVAPGPVHTPIQVASRPAEEMEGFGKGTMLDRVNHPSEVAPSFIFLGCKDSELYYGQVLHPYALGD